MQDECYPDPRLPQDLERLIFVRCASHWPQKSSFRLLLVAKRVREWLRPILFQVFRQIMTPYFPRFKKYPSLKLEDLGRFAKHLIIGLSNSREELDLLLASCLNIYDLAMWSGQDAFKNSFPAIQRLPLKRLSAPLDKLNLEDFHCPVFSNLTHLDIVSYQHDWDQWVPLTTLPNLTHIAINSLLDITVISKTLLLCTRLRTLVFLADPDDDWVLRYRHGPLFGADDYRLVLMTNGSIEELVQDWEKGANGQADFWVLAELFSLARRDRYLLDPSQRWITLFFNLEEELNAQGKEWYTTMLGTMLA